MKKKILSAIPDHPNILKPVKEIEQGLIYNLIPDGNLSQNWRNVDFHTKIKWCCQICDVLIFLDKQGIIHNDINPWNILISDNNAIVIDFGYSTTNGDSYGTHYRYSTPQNLCGEKCCTKDVYCLGIVMWELMHEKYMFLGQHPNTVTKNVLENQWEPCDKEKTGEETANIITGLITERITLTECAALLTTIAKRITNTLQQP
jgi:serine/threonine protein kinase